MYEEYRMLGKFNGVSQLKYKAWKDEDLRN
jgi:hypothetical protein